MDAMSIIGADCEAHMRIFIRLYLIFLALMILLFCIALFSGHLNFDGRNVTIEILHNMGQIVYGADYESHLVIFNGPMVFIGCVLLLVGIFAGVGWMSYRLVRSMKKQN
jgi:hypothetical protein